MKFEGLCYPTGIGSVPLTDPAEGFNFVNEYFPEIPFWAQLPNRSNLENMYIQYSEKIPGVVLEKDKFYVDLAVLQEGAERFYENFLEEKPELFDIGKSYAAGYHFFRSRLPIVPKPYALKGQITGPVSFCMQMVDETKKALLYDDTAKDILIKALLRNAQAQEKYLKRFSDRVIMFLDEPYLVMYGSAFSSITKDDVKTMLEEVMGGLSCVTAVHCCGNTDWSVLLETSVDILSFDAFSFADNLALYPECLKAFIQRGGNIAWGVVPTDLELIRRVSLEIMKDKLEKNFDGIERLGIGRDVIARQSLITPACGVGSSTVEGAAMTFQKTTELAKIMRKEYI